MQRRTFLALAGAPVLFGCGGSDDPAPRDDRNFIARVFSPNRASGALIVARPLVPRVTDMRLDVVPGGVILRAVGLPPLQGYWGAELVPANDGAVENGVLTYLFELLPPTTATRVSTERSREVLAGLFLSDQDLRGVREVRVAADQNALGRRVPG